MHKEKEHPATTALVVRPILTSDYGSRGQVDLMDMQSMVHNGFKRIMVYQDQSINSLTPVSVRRGTIRGAFQDYQAETVSTQTFKLSRPERRVQVPGQIASLTKGMR